MNFPQTTPKQQGKIILWSLGLTILGAILYFAGATGFFVIGGFILSGGLFLSLLTVIYAIGDNKWRLPWGDQYPPWDEGSYKVEIKVKQRVEAQIQSQILNRIETKTKNYEI